MDFVLSKIVWLVLQPSNLLLLVLIVLAYLGWRRALLATLGLTVLAVALPIGAWLTQPLEERFTRPATLPETVDGIIVLGGAQQPAITARRGVLAVNDTAERLIEAYGLARRHPEARLVLSGGSGRILAADILERKVDELFIEMVGLDPARVVFEDDSRNSWENALYSRALVEPAPDETWLLVTSAAHMPRSVGIFRRLDWPVVPWPVDYRTSGADFELQIGMGERLDEIDYGAREWVGLLAYRLMGRTATLFPAP